MAKDILIVDDDKNICKILHQYCINMGCFNNIVVAHDGSVGSAKLDNQKFDVIILDINMPKRSGIDILRDMSKSKNSKNQTANVVVITGSLEKEKMQEIIACGCRNFLVKPFDEASFQEKVLKMLTPAPKA